MGTVVRELDPETQTPMFEIADLVHDGERVVVAPAVPAVWAIPTL